MQLSEKIEADCREYAKVMTANGGRPPMRCNNGAAELNMQLRKGTSKFIKEIIDRWNRCGIRNVPEFAIIRQREDYDSITLRYTDVCNLVELVREYATRAAMDYLY